MPKYVDVLNITRDNMSDNKIVAGPEKEEKAMQKSAKVALSAAPKDRITGAFLREDQIEIESKNFPRIWTGEKFEKLVKKR